LGNGAMGNARWRGVPLKAVLDKAGVQQAAKQVTFNGMDGPVSDKTPDFVKALDIDHARDGASSSRDNGEVVARGNEAGNIQPSFSDAQLRIFGPAP
jgi:DMSO/TMAO reductase YedYZ molybdopterin-dependent catalytic subunit